MAIPGIKSIINFSNRKYVYIGLAAIIIIVISAIVITLLLTGRDKNVKDLYLQLERKNLVNRMNEIEKKYNEQMAKTRPLREQPSRTRYEISVKLSRGGDGNNNNGDFAFGFLPAQAVDVINSSKIVINSRYDIKNKIKMSSLSFLLEGQSFLDINAFWDKDLMGIQVPVIYDKYFVFDNNDVSSALRRFGLDIPIRRIILPSDLKEELKNKNNASPAPSEIRNILEDYISFLEENITEEQVSVSRNTSIESPAAPANEKYDVFTVKLAEEQFKAIASKTTEYLFSDKRFLNATLGQAYSMLGILMDAGYLDLAESIQGTSTYGLNEFFEPHGVQDLEKDFDERAEKLRQAFLDAIENTSFPGGFSMVVGVDKKDRKGTLASKTGNERERLYNLHSGQHFANIYITQEAGSNQDGKALIEIETQKLTGVGGSFTRINCENNFWPDFEALINTRKETDEDDKNKTMYTNHFLDIKLTCRELGMENENILIDIRREDRYGVSFNLPEISEFTVVNINTIDEDAVKNIQTEIQFSALRFILANQYLLDAFTVGD